MEAAQIVIPSNKAIKLKSKLKQTSSYISPKRSVLAEQNSGSFAFKNKLKSGESEFESPKDSS